MSRSRIFLTRVEATRLFGLADASQPVQPDRRDLRLAVRDPRDGEVYEAEPGERLHAQLVVRLRLSEYEAGWTIEARSGSSTVERRDGVTRSYRGLPFVRDDGGRAAAGYRGSAGDCVVRACAIGLGLSYAEVYDELFDRQREWLSRRRRASTAKAKASPRTGVFREVYQPFLSDHGWGWVPTIRVGQGVSVHLRAGGLPEIPRLIARCSRHIVAVVDGVLRDTHDCARGGTRAVYGYFAPRRHDHLFQKKEIDL